MAQNKRFHRLRAAASSSDGLSRLPKDDFAEWLGHARMKAADSRHGKAAAKEAASRG
jgi:hypothetical protein